MRVIVISLLAISAAGLALAQSSKTIVVAPATPAAASAQAPAAIVDNSSAMQGALHMLQEMKATNDETLRKQAAMLQQLDELEQAADQLKIYAKRG